MPPSDDDTRYEAILRKIAAKKQEEALAPARALLVAVLDGLNAAGFLTKIGRQVVGHSVYGPATFQGVLPGDSGVGQLWLAAIIWHKPQGYGQVETLGLLGIWALTTADGIEVRVGEKMLPFSAPVFNAESYYHHIRRRFDLYYDGDASPPGEAGTLYATAYTGVRRLTIRAEIQAALRAWAGL
ncbi:MAG: hypothetical protein H6672_21480 [Anaerolineaceae bacterium]|nr:hypothetical protein [Anaerolineaceae bacterium]